MRRLANITSFVVIALAGILVIISTFWLVYPYKVMTINGAKAVNSPVMAGGELEISIKAMKHLPLPAKVLGAIENDHAFPMAEIYSNTPTGIADWVLRIKMPDSIPEGEYRFHRTYIYQVNPLRSVTVDWSVPFFVKGRENGGEWLNKPCSSKP